MMGYYIVAISWGSNIGPLCGGFIIGSRLSPSLLSNNLLILKGVGWRWQKWVSAIFLGINFLMVFFLVPETRFRRVLDPTVAPEVVQEPKSVAEVQTQGFDDGTSKDSGEVQNGSTKTYLQQLDPWSGIDNTSSYLNLFLRPFPLILYPACLFATLACKRPRDIRYNYSNLIHILDSISLAPTVVFSIVSSFVFEATPYNFTAGMNGLVNIPGLSTSSFPLDPFSNPPMPPFLTTRQLLSRQRYRRPPGRPPNRHPLPPHRPPQPRPLRTRISAAPAAPLSPDRHSRPPHGRLWVRAAPALGHNIRRVRLHQRRPDGGREYRHDVCDGQLFCRGGGVSADD